jgi:hypothetical protein
VVLTFIKVSPDTILLSIISPLLVNPTAPQEKEQRGASPSVKTQISLIAFLELIDKATTSG